jgi:hypothetical protein
MDLTNCPRHTRRGFSRGEFLPADLPPDLPPINEQSPAPIRSVIDVSPPTEVSALSGLPKPYLNSSSAPVSAPAAGAPSESFLTFLAQEITGQASQRIDPYDQGLGDSSRAFFTASSVERIMEALSQSSRGVRAGERDLVENLKAAIQQMEEESDCDPHLDAELAEDSFNPEHFQALADFDLSFGMDVERDDDEWSNHHRATVFSAHVKVEDDGRRVETFDVGSKVLKDALGRVIEVKSPYGDMLGFNYGMFGSIESVWRTDGRGRAHSEGAVDKHGVVIRDSEGRVRAAGQSMTVDPRGCFFLHTVDSQFFSVDLVSGVHIERRKYQDDDGGTRQITALFTHDGFRMATVFAGASHTEYGEAGALRYRFYGRDGTLIEFACAEDLDDLRPSRVMPPASRRICPGWRKQRQANTAWQAVQEYLDYAWRETAWDAALPRSSSAAMIPAKADNR